ncbi:MAG: HEAT repeat domain-containing protein, partial [Chloroflexota bacterium]
VRHMSASSLSAFNTDKVVDVLIDALENEPTNLNRMTIAISLGKLKNKRAIPALIKALKTQDHQVTYGVAFALKEFGNLAQPKLKKVYDEYPEKVKTAFNTLWNFMKQFVIQPSRISQELEVSIMSKDQIKVIHAYLPPVKEWDCPICGRNRNQLTWYHLHSKNNQELTGSWAIVCDSCDIQVSEYRTRDY